MCDSKYDFNITHMNNVAVTNFQTYLQIPSVYPNVKYDECVKFLQTMAKDLHLPCKVYYCYPEKPIVIITLLGKEPDLPSILLNSHMDVVAVYEDKWKYEPFSAYLDEKGNIYARGAQDCKCIGIQYLEAIRRLKFKTPNFKRTIHVSFVPDEEIGGAEGMQAFIKTSHFKDLNVGFALDEGIASTDNDLVVLYAERSAWQLHIHCPGETGHGSLLLKNTAGEKFNNICNKFFEFRAKQQKRLSEDSYLTTSDVTSVNLTKIKGGIQTNVIPPEFVAVFDCRIPATVDLEEWQNTIEAWCKEAGEGVWIEYEQKQTHIAATKLDESNDYWNAFKNAADKLKLNLKPRVCVGITDARHLRELGIPALGFSPINNTKMEIHKENEYLGVQTFLCGIKIYCLLIPALAEV